MPSGEHDVGLGRPTIVVPAGLAEEEADAEGEAVCSVAGVPFSQGFAAASPASTSAARAISMTAGERLGGCVVSAPDAEATALGVLEGELFAVAPTSRSDARGAGTPGFELLESAGTDSSASKKEAAAS